MKNGVMSTEQMLALVLAGGQGKRMDILSRVRPKPLLPFAGRVRIIDFSLSNCIHSQVQNIGVLTDYQRWHMARYLADWYMNNPVSGEFHILEPRSGSYEGTADAVYQNLDYLEEFDVDTVLILSGDHVYKMDYRRMFAFHKQMKADVTVGVVLVPIEDAHHFGIVTPDNKCRIVDFIEKPRFPRSNLVSMGIYIFNKQVLYDCLIEDAAQPDSPHDFGYAVMPKIIGRDRIFAYKFSGYWRDIGTAEAFYKANMEIISPQAHISLDGRWPILTGENRRPLQMDLSKLGRVVNSLVSPGCVIKGYVENSILSPGVLIDNESVIRNSVLMSGVSVGHNSVVERCIIDEYVNIGKFCYVGFKGSFIPGEREITVLGKGLVVPSNSTINNNCKVLTDIRLDDFATTEVPSSNMVSGRELSEKS